MIENEVPATTESEGSYDEVIYCSRCNAELSRNTIITEKIDTHIHTPAEAVKENEISATCENVGGYENVIYCSGCNEELSREFIQTTEMLEHEAEDEPRIEDIVEAEEYFGGWCIERYYCKHCNTPIYENVVETPSLTGSIIDYSDKLGSEVVVNNFYNMTEPERCMAMEVLRNPEAAYRNYNYYHYYYYSENCKILGLWILDVKNKILYSAKDLVGLDEFIVFTCAGVYSGSVQFNTSKGRYAINVSTKTFQILTTGGYTKINDISILQYSSLSDECKEMAEYVANNIEQVAFDDTEMGWKILYSSPEMPIKGVWLSDGYCLYLACLTEMNEQLLEFTPYLYGEFSYIAEDGHVIELECYMSQETYRYTYKDIMIINYDLDEDFTYEGVPVAKYIIDNLDSVLKIECDDGTIFIYAITEDFKVGVWYLYNHTMARFYSHDDQPLTLVSVSEDRIYTFESEKYRVTIKQENGSYSCQYKD